MAYLRFPLEDGSELLVRVDGDAEDGVENGADVLGSWSAFLGDAFVGLASAPPKTISQLVAALQDYGVLPAAPDKTLAEIGNDVRMQLVELGYRGGRVDYISLTDGVWTVRGVVDTGRFLAYAHATGYVTSLAVVAGEGLTAGTQ